MSESVASDAFRLLSESVFSNSSSSFRPFTTLDYVQVSARSIDEAWVEIRVGDGGPGLSADAEERLFEPFFSTKAQGMGLGLSICKSIMSSHGGELKYERNARGGADFIMRLPVYAP